MSSPIAALEKKLAASSYIEGNAPTQADAAEFKALQKEYPNFVRWIPHIHTFVDDFSTLPAAKVAAVEEEEEEEDSDEDMFASDNEEVDEEAEKIKAERIAAYNAKKAAKPKTIAKSSVTIDVKPWDDETDMNELFENVKKIEMDGLVWGGHKFVEIGYGIKKLQMNLTVEDDKVSMDVLQELIEEDEDHVQSFDVVAMQKV